MGNVVVAEAEAIPTVGRGGGQGNDTEDLRWSEEERENEKN